MVWFHYATPKRQKPLSQPTDYLVSLWLKQTAIKLQFLPHIDFLNIFWYSSPPLARSQALPLTVTSWRKSCSQATTKLFHAMILFSPSQRRWSSLCLGFYSPKPHLIVLSVPIEGIQRDRPHLRVTSDSCQWAPQQTISWKNKLKQSLENVYRPVPCFYSGHIWINFSHHGTHPSNLDLAAYIIRK